MEDIDFLMLLGEEAKMKSTGTGFSEEKREQKRQEMMQKIEAGFEGSHIPLLISNSENVVGYIEYDRFPKPVSYIFAESPDDYPDVDTPYNRWNIVSAGIEPESRRKGYWKKAAQELENLARAQGVRYMSTDVGAENAPIIRARESLGYVFYPDTRADEAGYEPGTKLFGIKKLT